MNKKQIVEIRTEPTPNPISRKFIFPDKAYESSEVYEIKTAEQALKISPLAEKCMSIIGVEQVFLHPDFLTINKTAEISWDFLEPVICKIMKNHLQENLAVLNNLSTIPADEPPTSQDEVEKKIIELINTYIRPAVARDGGDIIFDSFSEGIVYLQLRGACSGCPSSTMTLKMGIENLLTSEVPEVIAVEASA